jgi:membrane associated rhomboid family serine protease
MNADDAAAPPSDHVVHPAEPDAAVCYRHPQREAHIRCVRCDRPICPSCMIVAPVGFQCPECVRGANAGQRVTRTHFGGRVAASSTPVATYALIAINVIMMMAELASPSTITNLSIVPGGMVGPAHAFRLDGVATGQYYRLLTGMFLHESPTGGGLGITHILFNMWALYVVGPPIERWLGRARFIAFYLLAGLCSSVAVYVFSNPISETLGASGAIFGLFAALFVMGRRLRFDVRSVGGIIMINLVITFFPGLNISWQGHVGGLLGGAALSAAWAYAPRRWRTPAQLASSIVLVALLVVIVVLRTHALRHGG